VIGLLHKSKTILTLALDRINNVKAEDKFISSENFSPEDFFMYSIGITQLHHARPEDVLLAVSKAAAPYLVSQPIHHSQAVVKETETEVFFSFRVYITTELKMMILGLGKDVEVMEPKVLREEIKDCIKTMVEKYKFKGNPA
jgi:predicted DNA-binding transcriptional regulator YafY